LEKGGIAAVTRGRGEETLGKIKRGVRPKSIGVADMGGKSTGTKEIWEKVPPDKGKKRQC